MNLIVALQPSDLRSGTWLRLVARADSTKVSPRTLTVSVLLASPAANAMLPDGPVSSTALAKSAALAGLAPVPVTCQATLIAAVRLSERVMVKVNGVLPELPSARSASVAAMARPRAGALAEMV